MNLDYNIFWVEDVDESFETYSRRIKRYVESKNFRCNIRRIKMQNEFDISEIDLNKFDILIVDYRLGESEDGREIIKSVRQGKYLNDVLFYSGEGEVKLLQLIQEQGIEGIFVSNKNSQIFIPKIESLIDKSIRRTIDPINIRGMVMDVTSGFDNDMEDIINATFVLLDDNEKNNLKKYISEGLIKDRKRSFDCFANKYSDKASLAVSDLFRERDFTAAMRAKLLNKIMQIKNTNIVPAINTYFEQISKDKSNNKVKFYTEYEQDILNFRNALAHVKIDSDVKGEISLGTINGVNYRCDEEFCNIIRKNLLTYCSFFESIYTEIEKL